MYFGNADTYVYHHSLANAYALPNSYSYHHAFAHVDLHSYACPNSHLCPPDRNTNSATAHCDTCP